MHRLINDAETYITQEELIETHHKTKDEAVEQFLAKPKFVDDQFVLNFHQKMESDIEEKFLAFNETNEAKYQSFMVSRIF